MLLTLVVPVYNRPDEMEELLASLSCQTNMDFEIIIVEDGSTKPSDRVVEKYKDRVAITYYAKENSGPGRARNYAADRAEGDYLVFLDSDCVIPEGYIAALHNFLAENKVDIFGGPDAAREDFSDFQKAVSYSMTSFFTTGGIRGGKKKLDKFFPRSFNMGLRRSVYNELGGFLHICPGEDMELCYRLEANNCSFALIPEAFVYHKRRSTSKSFCRQVFFFGFARINLYKRYPKTLKLVHLLPASFVIYVILSLILTLFVSRLFFVPIILLAMIWFVHSTVLNKSANVGVLSIKTSFIQLLSYGCGTIYGVFLRLILKKSEVDVKWK